MPGSKRGRLLIRQSRIKKDADPLYQPSPEEMDFETFSGSTYPHHLLPSLSQHVKIERHVSEPAPGRSFSTSSSMHLLSVPQQPPLLTKQHSHPLLPSQSSISSDIQFAHQSHPHHHHHHPHLTLHRQLSYPTSTEASSLLLQTSSLSSSPIILTTPPPSALSASSMSQLISFKTESLELGGGTSSAMAGDSAGLSTISSLNATDLRSAESIASSNIRSKSHDISPTIVVVSEPLSMSTLSVDHIPSLRVKSEELQRSLSTPQNLTSDLSLEGRSQHCPVIRPGPALGCNFCWNTIDAHGRILRRKTKYHCPECQTNLCIVPCFQEYHERQNTNEPSSSNENTKSSSSLRHHSKTGSLS